MFVSFNESIETLYKFAALESPEYDHVSKIDSYWDIMPHMLSSWAPGSTAQQRLDGMKVFLMYQA
jgi:hypothetical protein